MRGIAVAIVAVIAIVVGVVLVLGPRRATESASSQVQHVATPRGEPARGRSHVPDDAPARPRGELWIEGRVVDRSGRAVAGVTVAIDTKPPRNVVTADNGVFEIDGVDPGRHRIVARGERGYAGVLSIDVTPAIEPIELVLRPARRLELTVVDGEDGLRPLADAIVDVRDPTRQRQISASDGTAAFVAVAPGTAWITVGHEARASAAVRIDVPEGAGTIRERVVLHRGRELAGIVRDPDEHPLAGATITAHVGDGPAISPVVSGEDGRFTIRISGETTRLRASATGFVAVDRGIGDEARELELVLGRGRTLAGRVEDLHGVPVPGAVVRMVSTHAGELEVTADDAGAFALTAVPATTVDLLAIAGNGMSEVHAVAGGESSQDGLVLVVPTRGWMRGTVIDGEGEPVANATVHATPDLRGRSGPTAAIAARGALRAVTDERGAFTLAGLRPGRFALRAVGSDEIDVDPITRAATIAATGEDDVVVRLLRGGDVRGRVLTHDGTPAPRFTVRVDTGTRHEIVGGEGSFDLHGIAAGRHVVTIDGPGLGGFVLDDVAIAEDELTDLGELRDDGGRTLAGLVHDRDGIPVAGAIVRAGASIDRMPDGGLDVRSRGGDPSDDRAESDRDGRFAIRGLPAGRLVAVAEHPDAGRSRGTSVLADDTAVTLELVPSAPVSGRVTIDGAGAPGVAVTLAHDDAVDARAIAITDDEGMFRFAAVPIGSATAIAMTQGRFDRQRTVRRGLEIGEHGLAEVALELGGGGATLRVQVPADGGDAIVMVASGSIEARDLGELQRAASRGDGSAAVDYSLGGAAVVFDALAPGSYTACAVALAGDVEAPADRRRNLLASDGLAVRCARAEIRVDDQTVELAIDG